MVYDVSVIGAGVIGSLIARELSRYNLKICILEKGADVASGSSKANSGIVHAGYDPKPGTLKARFNVRGNDLFQNIAKELDVPFKRIGSLVLAFSEKDMEIVRELFERGVKNGVKELKVLSSREEVAKLEPNVSPLVVGALYAPSAGITCPYELTYAAAENAVENGAVLLLETEVNDIKYENGVFILGTSNGTVYSRYVVNAAGVYSDRIAEMIGDRHFKVKPRKGEYMILDKDQGHIVNTVVFQTPSEMGKGVLVTPTVDGNLLIGPNATDIEDKDDLATTAEGLEEVIRGALKSVPNINLKQVIASFAGLRATPSTDDFIISPSECNERFINAAGIESPGLTAAPAIAEYVAYLLNGVGLELVPKDNFNPCRKSIAKFSEATDKEKEKLIEENRLYGNIVCRCEMVTEAEIVESIRRPAGARNVDAVKHRTRAGMGRCHGGFCTPKVVKILSRELNIPMENVTKNGGASTLLVGETKGEL